MFPQEFFHFGSGIQAVTGGGKCHAENVGMTAIPHFARGWLSCLHFQDDINLQESVSTTDTPGRKVDPGGLAKLSGVSFRAVSQRERMGHGPPNDRSNSGYNVRVVETPR